MAEIKERPTSASAAPRGAPIDRLVFGVAATLSVAFVLVGAVWPEETSERATSVLGWVTGNFGWLFVLTSCGFVIFSAYLALSRYGNIKLGPDDSEPEFSTVSWVSMMFATGMGIGLMFWGVAEPLTHFNAPPLGEATPGSPRAAELAMQYSFFHWGLHPWAMYAVIGLAIGYFAYRKGYGNLISATFRPLLGEKATQGPGRAIDVVAIFATLFGSATSLGLGALQITGGLDNVFGSGAGSKTLAVIVIAVLTGCFVLSAVSGVERGIKYLSNANAIAAALLAFFLFVVGPTVFILSTFTQSMGAYLTQLPAMSFTTGVFEEQASSWLSGWTIFYWAWWISWTPFVGMFIARISKGRTIREFVIYVVLVPSLVSFIWFAILGGTALDLQLVEGWEPPLTDTGGIALEASLFEVLREFPLASITVALAVFLIAIFFVTGADAASIVMGMLSQHGEEEPHRSLIVFWGVATGAVAAVLLWAGGLAALQTLVILVAAPFMLILIGMCVSLMRSLREESYESTMPMRNRRAWEHSRRFPDGP
ncbi:BCCT family transporter [Nocardioides euryhalodurans]|uniref:BCCT family transporter n=1 Tax=Nocardioides euryhalodurans TaxID=2518370 RepID=A0A4P7GLA7_9ACTN|nr:BCCT family transporter [Nocardioides euryhalodurans]QBR92820.1 BCCT family transporter [Nocardioides euryhalodurans]